jgi:hypothetical protein
LVVRQIKPLQIAQLSWDSSAELVVSQREILQLIQVVQFRWDSTTELVGTQIESSQLAQVANICGNSSAELVGIQFKICQLAQVANIRRDITAESVVQQNNTPYICICIITNDSIPTTGTIRHIPPGVIPPVGTISAVIESDKGLTLRCWNFSDCRAVSLRLRLQA